MKYQKYSGLWFVARTLSPSVSSVLGSFVFVLIIISVHLLILVKNTDLWLVHVGSAGNDQLTRVYNDSIVVPLNSAFGSDALGVATTALVWGAFGFVVYTGMDYIIGTVRDWRRGSTDIQMQTEGRVVEHPLQRQVIIRILWRFLLGVIAVIGLIVLQPVIASLFGHDVLFLQSTTPQEMLKHIAIATAGWLAILHAYIVLFRLFVFRTRVFGEIIV